MHSYRFFVSCSSWESAFNRENLAQVCAGYVAIAQVNRKVLLDQDRLNASAKGGDLDALIAPVKINVDRDVSFRSPYEYIYSRYNRRECLQVRKTDCDGEH